MIHHRIWCLEVVKDQAKSDSGKELSEEGRCSHKLHKIVPVADV